MKKKVEKINKVEEINKKVVDRVEGKTYFLAEQAMDIAISGDIKTSKEVFKRKLEASKHGLALVNSFKVNERINRALDMRGKINEVRGMSKRVYKNKR